jgi:fucose permease
VIEATPTRRRAMPNPLKGTARGRLAVAICYAAMFMLGFTISLLGPSLPGIAGRTGVTLPQAGFLFTLFAGGSILATLLVARWNDHPIRRWTFLAGALLMAAGLWFTATSGTFVLVGAAIAVTGLAMSTEGTVPNAVFVDLYRDRAGRALNKLHVFVGVGSFVGPLLLALAYRSGADYTVAYTVAAGLMMIVALLWVASDPPVPVRALGDAPGLGHILILPLLLVFALAALYTGTEQVLAGWLFTYGTDALGLAAAQASLATSILWGAVLLGRLMAVTALRRFSNVRWVRLSLITSIIGVLLILGGRTWEPLFWAGVGLVGLGFGPIFPTSLALASELAPDRAGAAGSFVVASGSVGAMILPLAAGLLIPSLGIAGSISLALVPLVLMLGFVWAISRRI